MRNIFFLIMMFFSLYSFGQEKKVRGIVVDNNGLGIPYAAIFGDDSSSVAYCDTDGRFSINIDLKIVNKVTFKSLGFQDIVYKSTKLSGDSLVIKMEKVILHLDPVNIVLRRKQKGKLRILGKKNCKQNGAAYMLSGDEVAIFLNANASKKGTLKDVFVYITRDGYYMSDFRVNVYSRDAANVSFPGVLVNHEEHIVHATTGNEWVKIDMSNEHIVIDDGIFVAIEWIESERNNPALWESDKMEKYYISDNSNGLNLHNGHVLGMTWGYGMQSLTYWSRRNHKDYWDYVAPFGRKKGVPIIVKHIINPMVFCTYN